MILVYCCVEIHNTAVDSSSRLRTAAGMYLVNGTQVLIAVRHTFVGAVEATCREGQW